MISTAHAGQHVRIKPGVVIGSRTFAPATDGIIQQEHTHNAGGTIITIVRLADGEEIPFFADELTKENHTMLDESRKGERVQTITAIETYSRKLPKGTQGTILYAQENNIGKVLIHVQWEDIGQYPVFLHEIESVPTGGPL